MKTIIPYLKIWILTLTITVILINSIVLYLFVVIEEKGTVSIPLLKNNKLFNKFVYHLIKICSNKELLLYYRGRNTAEIIFYVIFLSYFLIFFN
jgi:hypothetical protein